MQRTTEAHEFANRMEAALAEVRQTRAEGIGELIAEGQSQGQVAKMLGLTRARVGKLLESGPRPERALLGAGPVTVAIGSKEEAGKPHTSSTSEMISTELNRAYHLIADAARNYDLEIEQDVISPGGHGLRLNRSNLIVIGSPRILPLVMQPLGADPNLGFGCGARGWYLTEGDKTYRSPIDDKEPADYGYIGRLPRTDGKGHFLYIAGIHAMGSLGAATYLVNNLAEVYQEVKNRRWSVLIECRFDPDTREIEFVGRLTQIYKP